jgi:glycosyltransferase involved in cell wall biosynthesis
MSAGVRNAPDGEFRKRLDILYVGTLPPHPGGSAISGAQLIVEFAELGHSVRALAPITPDALRSGDRFAVRHPEIGVTRFVMPYFETSPDIPAPDDYRTLEHEQIRETVGALVANERPDVILVGRESFAWHVPDLAKAFSIPWILRTAGSITMGILNRSYPQALAERMLEQYRKADLIVTPAKHMAERLRGMGFTNLKAISNAVNVQRFSPRPKDNDLLHELAIREDEIVVAHVSNLKAVKRPLDLVHSAEKASKQHSQLIYVIVGDGDLRSVAENTCEAKNLLGQFRFVGWIDYDRMPYFINLADIVVMASEAEGLARVYLETQACGRLLLASDIAAAREVIADGETGLLFRKGDIEDLTAKTLLAAGDPRLRAAIGHKARAQVEKRSVDHVAAEYVAALEGVIR